MTENVKPVCQMLEQIIGRSNMLRYELNKMVRSEVGCLIVSRFHFPK